MKTLTHPTCPPWGSGGVGRRRLTWLRPSRHLKPFWWPAPRTDTWRVGPPSIRLEATNIAREPLVGELFIGLRPSRPTGGLTTSRLEVPKSVAPGGRGTTCATGASAVGGYGGRMQGEHRRGRGPRQPGTVPPASGTPHSGYPPFRVNLCEGVPVADKSFYVCAAGCDCSAGA
eukprot:gene14614-biopygen3611